MSRRDFLGCAAGVITVVLPGGLPSNDLRVVVLLDLKDDCALRESIAGYEVGSAGLGSSRPMLIVPAALAIPAPAISEIAKCLREGGTVLLESGAGFASESRSCAHRDAVRHWLGVCVESARFKSRDIPYVDYAWPHPAKIRDFSRIVPLGRQPGEIIARADGLPVALKRQCGPGTLIYLGSPLGPALWAGDAEAKRWLLAVLA